MVQEYPEGWKEFLRGWLKSPGRLDSETPPLVVFCQIKVHSHVSTITGYYLPKAHPNHTIIDRVTNASMVNSWKLRKIIQIS
jgi:hypothetical protein